MSNIETRLGTAYSKLGLREPFIAAVMTKVKREVTTRFPTAATDGTTVYFNPDFCEKFNDEQLFGLVLHEACHIVLMHMWRRDGRDPNLWNFANDAIINEYIRSRNYQLPDGGVGDPNHRDKGPDVSWVGEEHSSEEVYNKLKEQLQNEQQSGSGQGDGDGDGSGDDSGSGGDGGGTADPNSQYPAGGFDGTGDIMDAVDEATRTDMEATIVAAAEMAKMCGQGSSLIDRVISASGESKVSWTDALRSMMTESAAADYTYIRPSKRFIAGGLYLPSLHSESLGGLAIGFDTSGSVTDDDCDQIAAEINAIVEDLQPAFVEIAYCDTRVSSIQHFDRGEAIELKPTGGGGTRFKPVFDYFAETGNRYCGMIYFTDMMGNLDECEEPEVPMIWADIGGTWSRGLQEPFGVKVEVHI